MQSLRLPLADWNRKMRSHKRSAFMALPMLALMTACTMDTTTPEPVVAPSHDYTLNLGTYQLVRTSRTTFEVSNTNIIGPAGGVLDLGLHQLVVPRGAVTGLTRFKMATKFGNNVIVDLTATDLATGRPVTQFPVELQLKLSYLLLGVSRSEAQRLTIVWLHDGSVEPVKTTLQPMQYYAVGWIDHFSRFAMAMN
jgi:hypothetical protein